VSSFDKLEMRVVCRSKLRAHRLFSNWRGSYAQTVTRLACRRIRSSNYTGILWRVRRHRHKWLIHYCKSLSSPPPSRICLLQGLGTIQTNSASISLTFTHPETQMDCNLEKTILADERGSRKQLLVRSRLPLRLKCKVCTARLPFPSRESDSSETDEREPAQE
jgi:hypothetical protein